MQKFSYREYIQIEKDLIQKNKSSLVKDFLRFSEKEVVDNCFSVMGV